MAQEPQNQEQQTTEQNVPSTQSQEPQKTNVLAIISYLWVLCLVPFLLKEKDEFVMFHAKQGLVLFIGWIVAFIISFVPLLGWILAPILYLLLIVFMVVGLINAVRGEKKPLPLIGDFAEKINI